MNSLRTYIETAIRTLRIGLWLYWLAVLRGCCVIAWAFGPPLGFSISATGLPTYTFTPPKL